ncbi:FCPF [Symbiodinium natans]|uniref:FCPF protein n=1 Tax=Symbiodinium natans TaxID=878477 RepID=A0A812UZ35_9DINO|nr:FCPF [Symbiodinium natans]
MAAVARIHAHSKPSKQAAPSHYAGVLPLPRLSVAPAPEKICRIFQVPSDPEWCRMFLKMTSDRFPGPGCGIRGPSKELKFSDVPNGLAALSKVPFLGWIQILVFCGMIDFGLYRADPSRDPGDYENGGILGVPNASGPMSDDEGRKRKLNSELANGRLAMAAITGMLFQNGITGTTGPAMWGF